MKTSAKARSKPAKWTRKDEAAANRAGFGFFEVDGRPSPELQRLDGPAPRFISDEAAIAWVLKHARRGGLAARALRYLTSIGETYSRRAKAALNA